MKILIYVFGNVHLVKENKTNKKQMEASRFEVPKKLISEYKKMIKNQSNCCINWLYIPYHELRLGFLAAAAAVGISWKMSFSKFVKKKSQNEEKLEKNKQNILKLESKKMGSFQMYEKSWKHRLPLLFLAHFFNK